jgi:CubicO group peptidase (beta-lactamase class C family)
VISAVAGVEYDERRPVAVPEPLGMTSTTYRLEAVPRDRLAAGYVKRDDTWIPDPIDPYGALAPMGGVFTTVTDLARWVAGFLDAFPARKRPAGPHPLARASRREMQQIHRAEDPELRWTTADAPPDFDSGGTGTGCSSGRTCASARSSDTAAATPGYGSHMRWHPASGIGVVGFSNMRYGPVVLPVRDALRTLVTAEPKRSRRPRPWPETLAARATVEGLLETWDDAAATDLFAMNIELDEPVARATPGDRRLAEVHGRLEPDDPSRS